MNKSLVVLKIGTSAITKKDGFLDEPVMVEIARQVAQLHKEYRLVIVSSGAVGTGKQYLPSFSGKLIERKAAAAIGNPLLLQKYAQFFAPYNIAIAQSLFERRHFADRKAFLQIRETYEELWANNIIPIANENDVVNDLELRFSDNDELASLIAIGFGASSLLLGTSVEGVLDTTDKIIPQIKIVDQKILSLARKDTSSLGLGGMISKLTFARLATGMGIKVSIFGIKKANGILEAMKDQYGTVCLAQPSSLSARKKWLASGSLVAGGLQIDHGAVKALRNRKSLLAVGMVKIVAPFEAGEVIEILDPEMEILALARTRKSAQELNQLTNKTNIEIAHADEIVLLNEVS